MIPVFWTRQSFEIDKQLTNEVKVNNFVIQFGIEIKIFIPID